MCMWIMRDVISIFVFLPVYHLKYQPTICTVFQNAEEERERERESDRERGGEWVFGYLHLSIMYPFNDLHFFLVFARLQ